MYHILMQEWMKASLGINVESLEEKMSKICWACGRNEDGSVFKTCTECKVPKYKTLLDRYKEGSMIKERNRMDLM